MSENPLQWLTFHAMIKKKPTEEHLKEREKSMTKRQLANRLRIREEMTWDQAMRIIENLFDDISEEVISGNDVYIPRFGRFFTVTMDRKRCIHPKMKHEVIMDPHPIVRFRMAEGLKRKLKNRAADVSV